jgi:hypothetical protein
LHGLLVAPISINQVADLLSIFARARSGHGNVDIPFLNAGGVLSTPARALT